MPGGAPPGGGGGADHPGGGGGIPDMMIDRRQSGRKLANASGEVGRPGGP